MRFREIHEYFSGLFLEDSLVIEDLFEVRPVEYVNYIFEKYAIKSWRCDDDVFGERRENAVLENELESVLRGKKSSLQIDLEDANNVTLRILEAKFGELDCTYEFVI